MTDPKTPVPEISSDPETSSEPASTEDAPIPKEPAKEFGGRKGPEPTRYGDWERNGIISDF